MTFSEDGKYSVTYADGSTKVGTYTIDENKKTITVAGEGVSILCPESTEYTYSNTTTDLHILALTEQKLQICVIRSDGQHMAMNFISGERKEYFAKPIYTVSLLSYGSADADWDNKATETVELYAGDTHTIKLEGERTCGTVTVLDFIGLRSKCPNAFIKIDKIKADGKEVSFDANKLLYGDLETNGNYRIELFNVWGAGTKNDSPFGGGAKDSEPALAFSQSLEITYTVVNMKDGQDGNMLEAGLSVEDHTWANSSWPDAKALLYFNGSVIGAQQSIKYEGSRLDGEIDVIDFNNAIINFPNMKLRVDEVLIDGKSLSFKAENIQYVANGDAYRIELFNPWGGTGSNNPWDTYDADNKCVPSLGFNSSFEVKYTVLNLF
jgi:hypothetical protein